MASRGRHDDAAFTLIEMVVVLVLMSLLAGATAPLAVRQIQNQRVKATQDRMHNVMLGMIGDPTRSGHGYLGDFGGLPAELLDLNETGEQLEYSIDPNDGIGAGYNGPYVPQIGASSIPFMDAWGTPFSYVEGIAQLTSAGPDRLIGTSDDLVHPSVVPVTTGNLIVSVTAVPNDAAQPCLLGEDEVHVYAAFAQEGERKEVQLLGPIGSGGPFIQSGLHNGFHGIRIEGQGAFAGAVARDVIELRGGNAQLRATLIQPVGEEPACRAAGAGSGSGDDEDDSDTDTKQKSKDDDSDSDEKDKKSKDDDSDSDSD